MHSDSTNTMRRGARWCGDAVASGRRIISYPMVQFRWFIQASCKMLPNSYLFLGLLTVRWYVCTGTKIELAIHEFVSAIGPLGHWPGRFLIILPAVSSDHPTGTGLMPSVSSHSTWPRCCWWALRPLGGRYSCGLKCGQRQSCQVWKISRNQ